MEIVKYISIFFFAAFVGGVPPGLVNMSVAKIVLKKNKKQAYIAAIGSCSAIYIQTLIGILMAKYIIKQAAFQENLLKIGVVIFGFLTIYFLVAAIKNKPIKNKPSQKDGHKSLARGFFVSAINVLPIPYYLLISTQLSTDMRDFYSWPRMILAGFSVALATFLVLSLYITAIVRLEKKTTLLVKYANFFMAALMFAIFAITLYRALHVSGV